MSQPTETSGLREYLRILRRGAWVIVLTAAVVVGATLFLTLRQQKIYESSAEVFLGSQVLNSKLTGLEPVGGSDPERTARTQANVARLPDVATLALNTVPAPGWTPRSFLKKSSVANDPNADILTFYVRAESATLSARLATAYADAYTRYRSQLDTAATRNALDDLKERLRSMRAKHQRNSSLYDRLLDRAQQLQTAMALQGSNAMLVRSASDASQIQPRPTRNGVLAGVFGLFLGIALAFARNALNTKVRTDREIEEALGLPLLARLHVPGSRRQDLVMRSSPESPAAESYRMLATNLEFLNFDRGARTIMTTSAHRGDGKSTTVANVGLAFARRGRRVALVDMDLRRPALAAMFGIEDSPGLTDVALGAVSLDEALHSVPVTPSDGSRPMNGANGQAPVEAGLERELTGTLDILPSGTSPPSAAEFIGSARVSQLLSDLAYRFDVVLIDSPPLLQVSDALILSAKVDGVLVLVRLPDLRWPALRELRRVLGSAPVAKLGFAITGGGGDYDRPFDYPDGYYKPAAKDPGRRVGKRRQAKEQPSAERLRG